METGNAEQEIPQQERQELNGYTHVSYGTSGFFGCERGAVEFLCRLLSLSLQHWEMRQIVTKFHHE